MELHVKHYNDLTKDELFSIYKARNAVLIYEQRAIFQDIDDLDKDSYHVFMEEDGNVIAYCRVNKPGVKYPEPSFGRVLCLSSYRRNGLGTKVVKAAMDTCVNTCGADTIRIESMSYIKELYAKLGFEEVGEEFEEEGVPHVTMYWHKPNA